MTATLANFAALAESADTAKVWVAVGPSLASKKAELEAILGPGFAIRDVLSQDRPPPGRTWVALLGTPELPCGQILSQRRPPSGAVVLLGTGPPSGPDGAAQADLAARLVESIYSIVASPLMGTPAPTGATSPARTPAATGATSPVGATAA